MWTSDERELSKALEVSYEFDEMCGLTWNAKKGALFAMDDAQGCWIAGLEAQAGKHQGRHRIPWG